jgi:phosphohistidine phosphatase SixA
MPHRITFRLPLLWLMPLLSLLLLASCQVSKPTTVYLVRHAEKETTPGLADPPLTPAGEQRAQALRDALQSQPISLIYTSDTKRTRATVAPLAAVKKLEPMVYNPKQPAELAKLIQAQPKGKTVLVVGHSNTVLETIEALGAKRPVPEMKDTEYDYLFKVTLPAKREATATESQYGASSR